MIKKLFGLIIFLMLCGTAHAGCTGSAPNVTCTPDYASVQAGINTLQAGGITTGNTLTILAGTANWNCSSNPCVTTGSITVPIHIIGATTSTFSGTPGQAG